MKNVKINITIDKQFNTGFRSEFVVWDMLFKEYNRLLAYDELVDMTKVALRKSEGFHMLTIDLFEDNVQFAAYRFVNDYGEIKAARQKAGTFTAWSPSSTKEVFVQIKEHCKMLNEKFVELKSIAA